MRLVLLNFKIVLLAGLDRTENSTVCGIMAGLIFYFLLVTFTWSFIEAINIYYLFIKVRLWN